MLGLLKLVLSFAPWLAFLVIARDSMFRVELGLCVALVLSLVMGATGLHRGVILWVGLAFFTAATVAVLGFGNMWTVRYMGVLANGALAAGTWYGVAARDPFTLAYAKAHAAPEVWATASFLRSNMVISSVWGAAFTVNAGVAWWKMQGGPELALEVLSYAVLLGAAVFTQWYPVYLRRQAGR